MEKYLLENPGTEIETRYVNQEPVDIAQNIEVRWLRPITPEIPPIIIQEVNVVEKEQPPIKIVQKSQPAAQQAEPIVIREKPNPINIPEPKTIYLPTVLKQKNNNESSKDIKIEHVRSDSQSNFNSRLVYDDQVFEKKPQEYAYEHASIVDYEEYEHQESYGEEDEDEEPRYKPLFGKKIRNRSIKEEQEIQMYEERLMQTLYEEYLLKLERERLERKLSSSGIFEERIRERERERSISQERSMSTQRNRFGQTRSSNRFSQSQVRINEERLLQDEEVRIQRLRDEEFRLQQQRLRDEELARFSRLSRMKAEELRIREEKDKLVRDQLLKDANKDEKTNPSQNVNSSTINKGPSDGTTSSFKTINFTKVTDENELNKWNRILNSSSGMIQNNAETDRTFSSLADVEGKQNESINDKYSNPNYHSIKSPTYETDKKFQRSNSSNLYKPSPYHESTSYYSNQFIKDDSAKRLNEKNNRNTDSGLYKQSNSDILSRSGSGIRRKVHTSYTTYYSSNYPNSVTEKNVYVNTQEK